MSSGLKILRGLDTDYLIFPDDLIFLLPRTNSLVLYQLHIILCNFVCILELPLIVIHIIEAPICYSTCVVAPSSYPTSIWALVSYFLTNY